MNRSRISGLEKEVQIAPAQAIRGLLDYCTRGEYGMALWREPGQSVIQGVIDQGGTEWNSSLTLEEMPGGFLFAPYDKNRSPHFIRAEIYFTIGESLRIEKGPYESCEALTESIRQVPQPLTTKPVLKEQEDPREHNNFVHLVEEAVEAIRNGRFLKVVPSRSKKLEVNHLDIPALFLALRTTYPNAFVSATYTPEHGLWMGASPELLVKVREGRYFETIALAGTQPYREDVHPGDVAWTQKEIEEQALVSRYIINCFKKIRLREFEEIGPKTVEAGNLIHLRTKFIVDMQATGFQQLGSVMLDLLHPTSAICGMPMEKADTWLQANETYDREFFSGFLGPVNLNDQTSLFVNLRCMKIDSGSVRFFAGAGVTEDSRPEKEWLETELKMNTLLNVLREYSTNL